MFRLSYPVRVEAPSYTWPVAHEFHSIDYNKRTARAERTGKSIVMATHYESMRILERRLKRRLDVWPVDQDDVMLLHERVNEAGRITARDQNVDNSN